MEGDKDKNERTTRNAGAIARARQTLRATAGGNPQGDGGTGNGGPSSDSLRGSQETGIKLASGGPNDSNNRDGASVVLGGGAQVVNARSRANERRTSVRDRGHGETGIGVKPENNGSPIGPDSGEHNPGGNAPGSDQEENEAILNFPPEAYFKDGKLKKSWAEKLAPGPGKKSPEPKPSALVKKKGISFSGDKDLYNQVTEGIVYLFQALDLGAEYGLGVSDVWELDENEAAVFTRILLKRADKGDKSAIKTIATISENMDLVQAATIVIPRVGVTIKEVAKNGIRPKINRNGGRKTPPVNPGQNPAIL